jgi:hypothetical protein
MATELRKMQVGPIWRLYGMYDTGTIACSMPRIAESSNSGLIDTIANEFASGTGVTYDPNNSDPF